MFLTLDEIYYYMYEQFVQSVQEMNELWQQLSESMEIYAAEADSPEHETKPNPLDLSRRTPEVNPGHLIPWFTSGFT